MDGKQLKNSILQWAIQGKLVPQNPKDEPAQKLLERIAASRNGGVSPWSGAIGSSKNSKKSLSTSLRGPCKGTKQSKNQPSCIYRENGVWYEQVGTAAPKDISDEIPFEIPESWEWVRLPMVGELNRGKSQARPRNDPSLFSNGTFPMIQTGDVARAETVISSCKSKYNEKGIAQSRIWPKGTICLTIAANIGDVAILGFDACFPDSVVGFNAYTPIDSNLFFLYALKCYKNILDELSRSTAQKNINIDILSKIFFPLPPLAEQKRIVAKLEQVLPLAEEYGAAQEQLDKLNKELPEALKKSILQEAIQGKLVPQNPKDEPASKLLERIAAYRNGDVSPWSEAIGSSKNSKKSLSTSLRGAKATKQSKNPPSRIYRENGVWYEQVGTATPKDVTDEIPFEIPETWTWCRIQNISQSYIGLTYRPEEVAGEGTVVLRSSNIKNGKIVLDDIVRVKTAISEKLFVEENDILICARNGSKKLVGKAALIPHMEEKMTFGAFMAICKTPFYAYTYFYLLSDFFYQQLWHVSGTTTINQLTQNNFNHFLIPLPPLAEQKRIVAKLEQLFKVL